MIPRILRVFVASPRDTIRQRRATDNVIRDLNSKFERVFSITLQTVKWEAFRPDVTEPCDPDIQQPITRRLDKCQLFIGILFRRYGSPLERSGISGTHEEFRNALRNRDRIAILTYYNASQADVTPAEIAQVDQLAKLKEEIQQAGVRARPFLPADFERILTLDLMETLLEMTSGLKRQEKLERFFRLGVRKDQRDPSVLIGYPPIHKHYGPSTQSNYNWTERLVPNVVYDDFKAIQKLEEALRILGVSESGSVTVPHPRLLDPPGNRIWLCIPRNPIAQEFLARLGDRVWFKFVDDPKTGSRFLRWSRPGHPTVQIRSPLAEYLKHFRPNRRTAWDPAFGYMVGRDYAILARFRFDTPAGGTPLYHYYLAGIRGLGTWGAGWFVAHCYEELAREAGDVVSDDIQLVLEVKFKDYRIDGVRIVSHEPQDYFDQVNADDFVHADAEQHVSPFPRVLQPAHAPAGRRIAPSAGDA